MQKSRDGLQLVSVSLVHFEVSVSLYGQRIVKLVLYFLFLRTGIVT